MAKGDQRLKSIKKLCQRSNLIFLSKDMLFIFAFGGELGTGTRSKMALLKNTTTNV